MRLRYYGIPIFALLTLLVMLGSCSDEWDTHYNAKAANKSELNLFEYIQSRPDLTTFTKMLKFTGYDSIISKAGTFTVWAPNDDALKNITATQLNDTNFVRQIVENHITRFSYTTSGLSIKNVKMMDQKIFVLAKEATGYSFGGYQMTTSDIATANGVVHIMGNYLPFRLNLWEYIHKTEGLDSLRTYLDSLTIISLDQSASYQNNNFVGYVYKSTNIVLDYLAAINTEDSIYTTLLPTNTAWTEAYNRISPYYNTTVLDGGVKTQMANTKWTLIHDLFFRHKIFMPTGVDTLVSNYGNKFANPDRLFANSQQVALSNGIGYVTDKLNIESQESWNPDIVVEAEATYYGRKELNYSASYETGYGTGFNISRNNYLVLSPKGTSASASVTFKIPNTLSGKYDIYCVFVPPTILDTADRRPSKVKFTLGYRNSIGAATAGFVDANNIVQSKSSSAAIFTTNALAKQPEKMLVASGFHFPVTNFPTGKDMVSYANTITVSLKVDNAAPDDVTANRRLMIDCIILKPVQ
jgi:hypothetical protein